MREPQETGWKDCALDGGAIIDVGMVLSRCNQLVASDGAESDRFERSKCVSNLLFSHENGSSGASF